MNRTMITLMAAAICTLSVTGTTLAQGTLTVDMASGDVTVDITSTFPIPDIYEVQLKLTDGSDPFTGFPYDETAWTNFITANPNIFPNIPAAYGGTYPGTWRIDPFEIGNLQSVTGPISFTIPGLYTGAKWKSFQSNAELLLQSNSVGIVQVHGEMINDIAGPKVTINRNTGSIEFYFPDNDFEIKEWKLSPSYGWVQKPLFDLNGADLSGLPDGWQVTVSPDGETLYLTTIDEEYHSLGGAGSIVIDDVFIGQEYVQDLLDADSVTEESLLAGDGITNSWKSLELRHGYGNLTEDSIIPEPATLALLGLGALAALRRRHA